MSQRKREEQFPYNLQIAQSKFQSNIAKAQHKSALKKDAVAMSLSITRETNNVNDVISDAKVIFDFLREDFDSVVFEAPENPVSNIDLA